MIVMGGIVGSGIFINPYVVARQVHTPVLILGAWIAGGIVALLGAFVYAELAALRPETGGQYAYLRDAIHPSVAFLYGWALLLVVQSGGMAAVAITFARYAIELTGTAAADWTIAAAALAILTAINVMGVRSGSNTQSALMILKIAAIAMLVVAGAAFAPERAAAVAPSVPPTGIASFGAALIPVMFAYGGWQTASFISGELRRPQRDLALGLVLGVVGVVVLYVAARYVLMGRLWIIGAVLVAAAGLVLALVATPLGDTVNARIDNGKSNGVRSFLIERAVDGFAGSPVIGYGSTRNTIGGRNSIAVGESSECERCGNFTVGGNGQFWQLMYAHGAAGTLAYLAFFGYGLWRFRRDRTPVGIAGSAAIVSSFSVLLWYNSLATPLVFMFLSYALL